MAASPRAIQHAAQAEGREAVEAQLDPPALGFVLVPPADTDRSDALSDAEQRDGEDRALLACIAQIADPILVEVKRRNLTEREAAELFWMSQARTRRLLDGHFLEFSATTVLGLLHRVGFSVASVLLEKAEQNANR